jgi:hypothetical protein
MRVYNYNICKFDFFDTAVADILRAIDGGSLMGSFVLSFCCIDYMGMAINPNKQKNSSVEFKQFVTDYLGAINPKYQNLSEYIWAVRNSLIHVYGESDATAKMNIGFVCSHEHPEYHLRLIKDPKEQIWLNLPDFVSELVAAIEHFFRSNKTNDALFQTWYSKLLIISGATTAWFDRIDAVNTQRPTHKRSHRCLTVLDEASPPSMERIVTEVRKCINAKLGNGS